MTIPKTEPVDISIVFDVDMCDMFPYRTSVWEHRKGAIDGETKLYIQAINALAREFGAHFQYNIVGSSLEDDDLEYLEEAVADGHGIGNHTLTHMRVKARTIDELQECYRLGVRAAPSSDPEEAKRIEIQKTNELLQDRLFVKPKILRVPCGYSNGLHDVPAFQQMVLEAGFEVASCQYVSFVPGRVGVTQEQMDNGFVQSVVQLQPYRYPSGLYEFPAAGVTEYWAFALCRVDLDGYIQAAKAALTAACERGVLYCMPLHPPVLACVDPDLRILRAILEDAVSRPGGGRFVSQDQIFDEIGKRDVPALATWRTPDGAVGDEHLTTTAGVDA